MRAGGLLRSSPVPLVALLISLLGLLVGPPPAAAQAPELCGPSMPTAEVRAGMVGQGLTVSRGATPEPFTATVLGVLDDGIAPGRDLIVVETDSPAITAAGGVWYGMSGSPVTVEGRLIGAVSYVLSFGPSQLAGLTPADDLVNLLSLAEPPAQDAEIPAEVAFTPAFAGLLRERSDAPLPAQPTLSRLRTPLSVSGLRGRALDSFSAALDDAGMAVLPHAGAARAAAPTVAAAQPQPGGNFAAALSYGDVTIAGVGTTTMVCGGTAVAFGHPFFYEGATAIGASDADAVAIVDDPTFGPYKLANLTGTFGTVDQDRLAGLRSQVGAVPATIPVTSQVRNIDTAIQRDGRTDVVLDDVLGELAAYHLLANIDVVLDRIGSGSSTVEYSVTGVGSETGPFELRRSNAYASPYDVAVESINELFGNVAAIANTAGEDVTFTGVDVRAGVEDEVRRATITGVRTRVDGGSPVEGARVFARPGAVLELEILLTAEDGADQTVRLRGQIPETARGSAYLQVTAGIPYYSDGCYFYPEECGFAPVALPELIQQLQGAPTSTELTLELFTDAPSPEGPTHPRAPLVPPARGPIDRPPPVDRVQTEQVVAGGVSVEVVLEGLCTECDAAFVRLEGSDRIATAVADSRAVFAAAPAVVLARADTYPDALAAAPLAATLGAPILLSPSGALPEAVAAEIRRLGATRVVLLGGPAALSPQVEADLAAAGVGTVERVAGEDRYDTARLIAERVGGTSAYLTEGGNADPARGWPDALSASPLAASQRRPVLLTEAGRLPGNTARALADLGATEVTVVGGQVAVSDEVVAAVEATGARVERVAGATRYETSFLLAQRAVAAGGSEFNTWFATGLNFPDALAAGPAVARTNGVLLLLDGQNFEAAPPVRQWLEPLVRRGAVITLLGGPSAISPGVQEVIFVGLALGFPGQVLPPSPEAPPAPGEPVVRAQPSPAQG